MNAKNRLIAWTSLALTLAAVLLLSYAEQALSDELTSGLVIGIGGLLFVHQVHDKRAAQQEGEGDERDVQIQYRSTYYSFWIMFDLLFVTFLLHVFTSISMTSLFAMPALGGLVANSGGKWWFRQRM